MPAKYTIATGKGFVRFNAVGEPIEEIPATVRQGYPHPIAYTYNAAYHCPVCTARAFGVSPEGFIPESARDSEGNPVGAVAPWDEWQSFTGEFESLTCDTCGGEIDNYDPDRS